ncbi:hypothetical protein BDF14DRAFT_1746431 [Spinellus fusiger]|nr:hypothetical protein BDF14DRAFT_1746431 [Spinellus fusiger]
MDITLTNGRVQTGRLYTVDPVSGNIVLIDENNDIVVIMHYTIQTLEISPSPSTPTHTPTHTPLLMTPAWIDTRKELMLAYLSKGDGLVVAVAMAAVAMAAVAAAVAMEEKEEEKEEEEEEEKDSKGCLVFRRLSSSVIRSSRSYPCWCLNLARARRVFKRWIIYLVFENLLQQEEEGRRRVQ